MREKFRTERIAKGWEEKSTTELRWENPRGKGNREGIIAAKGVRERSSRQGKGRQYCTVWHLEAKMKSACALTL